MKEVSRLFDIPYYQLENYPIDNALVTKYNGQWQPISTKEYVEKINQISRALLRIGIQPNDKIIMKIIINIFCNTLNILCFVLWYNICIHNK